MNRLRAIAAMIRSSPRPVGGGIVPQDRTDDDRVPHVLSLGCALVPASSIGADCNGPVIVWSDGTWEPAVRDDLPAGFGEASYDRVAEQ